MDKEEELFHLEEELKAPYRRFNRNNEEKSIIKSSDSKKNIHHHSTRIKLKRRKCRGSKRKPFEGLI